MNQNLLFNYVGLGQHNFKMWELVFSCESAMYNVHVFRHINHKCPKQMNIAISQILWKYLKMIWKDLLQSLREGMTGLYYEAFIRKDEGIPEGKDIPWKLSPNGEQSGPNQPEGQEQGSPWVVLKSMSAFPAFWIGQGCP